MNDFIINVFHFCELLGIPEIHCQLLLRMHILNCIKQQIMHRHIYLTVYSRSIILFFENSSSKASGCSSFSYRYTFSGSPAGLLWCLSVIELQKSPPGKLDLKTAASRHNQFLALKKNAFKPKLTSVEAY